MDLENKKREIITAFQALKFEEDRHIYSVDGRILKYSVSGIIKRYANPFNANKIAPYSAKKEGLSVEQVLKNWRQANRESIKIGNAAHLFGEKYMFDRTLVPQTGYDQAIKKFWDEIPDFLIPVFAELKTYHKTRFYAGTIDIVLYNTLNNSWVLADYKTNKDLFKNYKGQMLRGKFSDLLDTPFNKYQIQLNYYKELIEQVPEINISKMKVVWIKPTGEYELYDCGDYSERIKKKVKLSNRWS